MFLLATRVHTSVEFKFHNEEWYFGAKVNNSYPWPVFNYWKAANLVDSSLWFYDCLENSNAEGHWSHQKIASSLGLLEYFSFC